MLLIFYLLYLQRFNLFIVFFSPVNITVKLFFMEYRVFKSSYERKLFNLYLVLDDYFTFGHPLTSTGFYDVTSQVLPLLFKCFSQFWCKDKNDCTKIIKK